MSATYQIDYLEFPSKDGLKTRRFFEEAFDWSFVSYGPTYHAIEAAGIDAGIQGDAAEATGAPLPVVRTTDLAAAQRAGRTSAAVSGTAIPSPICAPSSSPAASSPAQPSIFPAAGDFISANRAAVKWRYGCLRHK